MFRWIRAYLQKEDAVQRQKKLEVTLLETSDASEMSSPAPSRILQMDGDQQAEAMESELTVVAEGDGVYGVSVVDFSTLLDPLQTQLEHLEALFQEKIREDDGQRQLFKRLMNELNEYRQDFIYSHITSKVFRDLIQLYDTLEQTLQLDTAEKATREALLLRMGSFRQQVVRTLQRQEVELVESVLGEPFDERTQEAIDVHVVERPEEDGTVVEIARRGFRYRERLLRPEWVIVGRYQNQ